MGAALFTYRHKNREIGRYFAKKPQTYTHWGLVWGFLSGESAVLEGETEFEVQNGIYTRNNEIVERIVEVSNYAHFCVNETISK